MNIHDIHAIIVTEQKELNLLKAQAFLSERPTNIAKLEIALTDLQEWYEDGNVATPLYGVEFASITKELCELKEINSLNDALVYLTYLGYEA